MGQGHFQNAFGRPGVEPRWTVSAKDAVGTAYSASSRLWYTLSLGVLSEIYFPTIDRPQTRDAEYLITDGETFFHEEKRDLKTSIERLASHALGFRVVSRAPDDSYRLVKQICSDPHQSVLLIQTRLEGNEEVLRKLKLYILVAPHLSGGGWENTGIIREIAGRKLLTAQKDAAHIVVGATVPFGRCSCGYVGTSDGWTDLHNNFALDWTFGTATDGNIALTGELILGESRSFTLGLGFGDTLHAAATALLQSLDQPFGEQRDRFVEQWQRICSGLLPLYEQSQDGGELYLVGASLLLSHEDKTYQGAMIASLCIPWGDVKSDDDLGGYHLVWTRDMYHSVMSLLAAGHCDTALRGLIYLACSQQPDGGFHQNSWIDGEAYWTGVQLDGVAFPVLLAWRLHENRQLGSFDPYPLMKNAARFLILNGPVTEQDRWEENHGYSPSTLASNIAALVCAASYARERQDEELAGLFESYADYLEERVEQWTVTDQGTLVEGVPRHYIRITPVDLDDPYAMPDPNKATVRLMNQPPGESNEFPAKTIVDAGFLELVRYGIRRGGNPLIEESLKVVDGVLKVDTEFGPCWRRYNHDGYGQRRDGGPFQSWGQGRAWPLLTGERGHYELAAGRNAQPYIKAMEGFASKNCLLPEQIWDAGDIPEKHMFRGRPTESAMPLMWAHAEYTTLLRSIRDGSVFDRIAAVEERYLSGGSRPPAPEFWKFNRRIREMKSGRPLRILAKVKFQLRWTDDDWASQKTQDSRDAGAGLHYSDVFVEEGRQVTLRFTFYWPEADRWEGEDFYVSVR